MKENEKKFRGHFFSPLRTVGNPKSFLGEKKKKKGKADSVLSPMDITAKQNQHHEKKYSIYIYIYI